MLRENAKSGPNEISGGSADIKDPPGWIGQPRYMYKSRRGQDSCPATREKQPEAMSDYLMRDIRTDVRENPDGANG